MAWPTLGEFFALDLGTWETYGLFFLLGSFTVATLSDLRHMSAQREFVEVWVAFAAIMAAIQLEALDWVPNVEYTLKWGLILGLGLLSWERIGVLFKLAFGDVGACWAAASLLSPGLVLAFWALLKATSWVAAPILRRGRATYPFLPVVSVATLGVLLIGLFAAAKPPT